jgi:hypothetical protein
VAGAHAFAGAVAGGVSPSEDQGVALAEKTINRTFCKAKSKSVQSGKIKSV